MKFTLTLFVALFAALRRSDACSCVFITDIPITPRCPQKFLSVVKITGIEKDSFKLRYKFDAIYDHTKNLAAGVSLSNFPYIISPSNSAACGVSLQIGKFYLLFGSLGDVPHLALCGSIFRKLETVPTQSEAQKLIEEIYNARCIIHEKESHNLGAKHEFLNDGYDED